MYEVGGNTNQKGDGQVGGELQMCERGTVPQRKINTKDRHYTVLGLTTLAGKPVMCVVIFAGETPCTLVETGLDLDAATEGHPDDADFFEKILDLANVSQVAPLVISGEWTYHVSADGAQRAQSRQRSCATSWRRSTTTRFTTGRRDESHFFSLMGTVPVLNYPSSST